MRNRTLINAAIGLVLLGALFVRNVRADEWDKKTIVSFSAPVQIPGTVLPAGTYVFKVADNDGNRYLVEIFDAHETQLVATIMAIPHYRMQAPDKTIISFNERPSGQPEALRAWFYPGDNFGVQFVYPKQRATELAQANQQPVLSTREEMTDTPSMKSATVEPVAPPTVRVADNSQPPSVVTATVAVAQPEELPKTASPIFSIGLGGVLLLAAAFGLRRFSLGCR